MSLSVGAATSALQVAAPDAAQAARSAELRAGAAVVDITPSLDRPVYLAGFSPNRRADSVHDALSARALVLEQDGQRLAIVALDLIGLPNHRIRAIRARVKSVPADRIVIACTHVHSGPDTLGLWGPSPAETGRDARYLNRLESQVTDSIERAAAALKPATTRFAHAVVLDGLAYNARDRAIQDKTITAMQLRSLDGQTIATLLNYGCHPEVMQNGSNAVTADFCGAARREIEREFGGVGIYLNGALGGMVTPEAMKNRWDEVERVGTGIAQTVVSALKSARPGTISRIKVRRREITLPLENQKFKAALAAGLLDSPLQSVESRVPVPGKSALTRPPDGPSSPAAPPTVYLSTEIACIRMGDAEIVTVPGELLPMPGLALRAAMHGNYRFIFGLGQDELGYILDASDFDRELYHYERGMSVGKQTWPLLFQPLKELIAESGP